MSDIRYCKFGPFEYERYGGIYILSIFNKSLFQKVGSAYCILGVMVNNG
jgi:hypothetical protein